MRPETKELLKENLVRINEKVQSAKDKVRHGFVKNALTSLYLASPPKVQFLLARYGMKFVLKNKKDDHEELIRH